MVSQRRSLEEIAKQWVAYAEQYGFNATYFVDSSPGYLPDLILEYCYDNEIGSIALETSKGSFESTVVGSAAREIIRASRIPVFCWSHFD